MNKTLYIAYGSNINRQQMDRRCPTAKVVAKGEIIDYELEFRGVATIVPKENSKVPVLMWELESADEKSLDHYEGFPRMYRKEYFEVELNGEKRDAMAYVMNYGEIHEPSNVYYYGIEQGYKDSGLDVSYLEDARNRAIEHEELSEQMNFDLKGWWS